MPMNANGREYRKSVCRPSKKNPKLYPGCGMSIYWPMPYAGGKPKDDILLEYDHDCNPGLTASAESMIKPKEDKEEVAKVIEKAYYTDQLTKEEARTLFKILAKLV